MHPMAEFFLKEAHGTGAAQPAPPTTEEAKKFREDWVERDKARNKTRKSLDKFTSAVRAAELSTTGNKTWEDLEGRDKILDGLEEAARSAGIDPSGMRRLARVRHRSAMRGDYIELEDLCEDLAEAAHRLLEEEAALDPEPLQPEEPTDPRATR